MAKKRKLFDDLEKNPIVKNLHVHPSLETIDEKHANVKIYRPGDDSPNYYVKSSDAPQAIASAISSNMYNNIDIATPPIHLSPTNRRGNIHIVQQDVNSIKDIKAVLAKDDIEYKKVSGKVWGKYKWQIFYDIELVRTLLQFMTPECLEQLKDLFLIDELRSDKDRHAKNFFFYKKKGEDKYSGVIAIDLELMHVLGYGSSKNEFVSFLTTPYQSETPQQNEDFLCFMQRNSNIRELLDDGVLSQRNIQTIKNALIYDLEQDAKSTCKRQKIHGKRKNDIVTPIARLWDFNRETIGRDLGL